MIFGYARVSTEFQSLNRQLDQLKEFSCDEILQEKITGTKKDRPELDRLLDKLRDGDILLVCDLSRLSRSVKDLFSLVEVIQKKGANVKSLKESWLDTTTPQGKLLFTIFAGISQFEADIISQRTKEGLASARSRGRIGGRKRIDQNKLVKALKMYDSNKFSVSEINETTGVTKPTLYRYLNERKKE